MSQPKDTFIQSAIDGWSDLFMLEGNVPLNENFDLKVGLFKEWIEYDDTAVDFELESTGFEIGIVSHLAPEEAIDPFLGISFGYQSLELEDPTFLIKESDNRSGVTWLLGFEWKINDQVAIRPQVTNGSAFDDFGFEEFLIGGAYFETEFIYWANESFFTGVSVGSDFDDTNVTLGFFLGIGSW